MATLSRALLVLGLAVVSAACDGTTHRAATSSGPRDVAPGDDWVAGSQALTVARAGDTVIPVELAAAVERLVRRPVTEIPAQAWESGAGRSLSVRPELRLDLAVGTPWVTVDGRVCRPTTNAPGHDQDASRASVFVDDASGAAVFWNPDTGRLLLRAAEPPELVAVGYHVDERSLLGLLAGPVDGAQASAAGADDRSAEGAAAGAGSGSSPGADAGRRAPHGGRVVLGRESRRALVAPAGTVLAGDLRGDRVDALHVAVGVAPLGFEAEPDGRLRRVDGRGDGVTFAVDLERAATADAPATRQRLWSRHVTADEGWVEERVTLPAVEGRLLFVTEAGPGGDRAFDLGLWGRLRFAGPEPRTPERPHVVIVDVDTLRADRLGCYGYERDTSPRLDAWAAEQATVFLDSTAAGTWTLPSTVSMLTGLSAGQHGVTAFPRRITERLQPLATRLSEAGYETWARVDGGFVSAPFGFDVGFDVYDYQRLPWDQHERQGWQGVLDAMAARRSERPLFVFLQTYQVHMPFREDRRYDDRAAPYDGPLLDVTLQKGPIDAARASGELVMGPADWRWLNDLYDAGVRRMDDVVGRFLEALDAALGGEPCLVILTSDHGEEIAERDGIGHGHSVHREVLSVPLIVRLPGASRVGSSRVPASGLDLVPTVLAAVGLPVPEELPGRDLFAPVDGPRLVVAEHGAAAYSARFDGWTLLRQEGEGSARLFDHAADPGERHDLSEREAPRAATLRERLADWRDDLPRFAEGEGAEQAVGAALVAELQALGYLGGDG